MRDTSNAVRQERRSLMRESRVEWYRRMIEIRVSEDRILQLFRDGHVRGSTHTAQGQEAVAVAIAAVARPTDWVTCTYRGHALALALGLTPLDVIGEILGREVGCTRGIGGSMHLCGPEVGLLPTFAIVGAGIPVAVGAALSATVRGRDDVAFGVFGDGAANIGAFHEGLNLAAIWNLPVVLICENNLYGEYSRIDRTTPIEDLADRGAAYRMASEVVDGQDVDAATAALRTATERARIGGGPTLIEMKTYRYAGHSRTDEATYRPAGELDEWRARDPIRILEERLRGEGAIGDDELESIWRETEAAVESVVEAAMASPEAPISELLEHVAAGSPTVGAD
jgi:pyruvate dehydrogenase E1 component alpha subunit